MAGRGSGGPRARSDPENTFSIAAIEETGNGFLERS